MEYDNLSFIEEDLKQFPPAILAQFQRAAPVAREHLSPAQFEKWAGEGIAIARFSFRAWEAALEYFKATPEVLETLSFADFLSWAQVGKELSRDSSALSAAYFRATPGILSFIFPAQIGDWARMGRVFYKETWRSSSLCCNFFEASSNLLRYLRLEEMELFVRFLQAVAEKSYDFADECMVLAEEVLPGIEREGRKAFLDLALVLAQTNWRDAKSYFASGPKILCQIEPGQRNRFLSLAKAIVASDGSHVPSFLFDGSQALGQLDEEHHNRVLHLFEEVMPISRVAAIEFLKSCPTLVHRIGISGTECWFDEGKRVLQRREASGEAFFRLESSKSEQVLERLSSRVELDQVEEVLHMYAKALTGRNAQIFAAESLKDKGIGWTSVEKPSTDGIGVYLPPVVQRYDTKGQNFGWYKVMVTHQAGHLEFGSFDFFFDKEAKLFSNWRFELDSQDRSSITDLERFFNLFADRKLAVDIFTAVEDSRVDYRLKGEYAGIRGNYERIQREALAQRPSISSLPLRQAFLEVLVQMSLEELAEIAFPADMERHLRSAVQIGNRVKSDEATVEDSAEATIRLYTLLIAVPNKMHTEGWQNIDFSQPSLDLGGLEPSMDQFPKRPMPEGDDSPYENPQQVEFRGDFKPELVQLLMKLRKDYSQKDSPPSPLSPEAIRELIEKNTEIEIDNISAGDLSSSISFFLSNLMDEAIKPVPLGPDEESRGERLTSSRGEEEPLAQEERAFLYDEWDFRAHDYKPKWCRVLEKPLGEGSTDFFDNTLKKHARLAARIKKQFEMLAPELFKKIKRLHDGDDFDLDAVIESMVEKNARITPSEKIYWRRNKVQRDISVVFLLDMSASTSEVVEETESFPDPWIYEDPRRYIAWLKTQREEPGAKKSRQIIDVEKESLVLLIGALETIGDRYGIYGFSGYGRDNVEFFVIKDIEKDFSKTVQGRIDKVSPLHATRMGPAIRHATSKLDVQDSKTKILILISDGRPQDQGYGRDSMEKDYAIHDTKMALLEAKRKDITPFCLTVDRAGQDYLKKMCHDIGYEVVWNIESLPKRLPSLYRRLTA